MANASLDRPTSYALPAEIAGSLRSLRRSVRTWLWIDGLSRVLAWTLLLAVVDLACDWWFRMDRPQRGVCLALVAACVVTVIYRRLIRPLSRSLDDDSLCLRVEAKRRDLAERLIGAVQFSRLAGSKQFEESGVSRALVNATIADGARATKGIDFACVLDREAGRRNWIILCVAFLALLTLGASAAWGGPMATWFNRNVMLGEKQWPQATQLVLRGVEDGVLLIPRGDDWDQVVEAQGIRPDTLQLDYRPHGWGPRVTEQMIPEGEREFHTLFKNVLEEFDFRVRGGDAQTAWITAKLIERPTVEELKLKLIPPAYAKLPPEELESGKGPYYALKGSSLEISGRSDKPIERATIVVGDTPGRSATVANGREFSASIAAADLGPQTYSVELVDVDGWRSKRPAKFTIKLKPDREPKVKVKPSGIGAMIVAGARIPLVGSASDDFAVTGAALGHTWRGEEADQAPVEGRIVLDNVKEQLGKEKITFQYTFDTEPLNLPQGANLALRIEATDNDDISGPKIGKSDDVTFKVVDEEELRADLLRREKEQRVELERLLKEQEELVTDARAILASIAGVQNMPDEQRQALIKTQKRQNLASGRLTSIATQMQQIADEVHNNRLEEENGELERRLVEQIVVPLRALAQENVPHAATLLDGARRATEVGDRDKALSGGADEGDKISGEIRKVLKFMAKAEGYQEAVNLLYSVLKAQNDLNEGTRREAQRKINEIFGPGGESKDSGSKESGPKEPKP